MSEFAEKATEFVPEYLKLLGHILLNPRTFIQQINFNSNIAIRDALIFYAMSTILFALLIDPRFFNADTTATAFIKMMATNILATAIMAGIINITWKVVGGIAKYKDNFLICCYQAGVATVIFTVFIGTSHGILRVFAPDLYEFLAKNRWVGFAPNSKKLFMDFMKSQLEHGIDVDYVVKIQLFSATVMLVGVIFVIGWSIIAWGAFRSINKTSAIRSVCALLVTIILSLPVIVISVALLA